MLSQKYGPTLLLSLTPHVERQLGPNIHHCYFESTEPNYLKRASAFSDWVNQQISQQWHLEVGHFRDIWGGLAILQHQHLTTVFEVNGLMSIELPFRYPLISKETLSKIEKLEQDCLQKAHLLTCPSQTIKAHLERRQVPSGKIHVITNGADIPERYDKSVEMDSPYVMYFGALQPWQGIDILLKSFKYLKDKTELKLLICSSHKEKYSRPYVKLANRLELDDQVIWKHKLGKQQLFQLIQHAECTVAPLTECSRNLQQGCSPLKIFESMACQTPVVASDIPVVREIGEPQVDFKLVRPDRPAELARAIRMLLDYPEMGTQLAQHAFKTLNERFTWKIVEAQLASFYDKLVILAYS